MTDNARVEAAAREMHHALGWEPEQIEVLSEGALNFANWDDTPLLVQHAYVALARIGLDAADQVSPNREELLAALEEIVDRLEASTDFGQAGGATGEDKNAIRAARQLLEQAER